MALVTGVGRAPPLLSLSKGTCKICPIIRGNYKFQLKRNPQDSGDMHSLMPLALIYNLVSPICLCFLGCVSTQIGLPKLQREDRPNLGKVRKFIKKGDCIYNFWTWCSLIRD